LYLSERNITETVESRLQNCLGIEKVVTDYLTQAAQVGELTRDYYFMQLNSTIKSVSLDLMLRHHELFRMSVPLNRKIQIYMQEFVRVSTELSINLLIAFSIIGFLSLSILSFLLMKSFTGYYQVLQQTRMMMNYIPLEVIDRSDILRNLVLYHIFPNMISDKLGKKGGTKDSNEVTFSSLSSIIDVHVDGTVVVNEEGEMEIFNPASHRIFGTRNVDVLGAPFSNLFDGNWHSVVKKAITTIIANSRSEHLQKGANRISETIEMECVRANQTKFPALVSFFSLDVAEKGEYLINWICQ